MIKTFREWYLESFDSVFEGYEDDGDPHELRNAPGFNAGGAQTDGYNKEIWFLHEMGVIFGQKLNNNKTGAYDGILPFGTTKQERYAGKGLADVFWEFKSRLAEPWTLYKYFTDQQVLDRRGQPVIENEYVKYHRLERPSAETKALKTKMRLWPGECSVIKKCSSDLYVYLVNSQIKNVSFPPGSRRMRAGVKLHRFVVVQTKDLKPVIEKAMSMGRFCSDARDHKDTTGSYFMELDDLVDAETASLNELGLSPIRSIDPHDVYDLFEKYAAIKGEKLGLKASEE